MFARQALASETFSFIHIYSQVCLGTISFSFCFSCHVTFCLHPFHFHLLLIVFHPTLNASSKLIFRFAFRINALVLFFALVQVCFVTPQAKPRRIRNTSAPQRDFLIHSHLRIRFVHLCIFAFEFPHLRIRFPHRVCVCVRVSALFMCKRLVDTRREEKSNGRL